LIAQVKKILRLRIPPLWPAQVNKIRRPKARSLWPFAMPMGLTILPSLEAARLYPWWVATLVFNAVWITLRLWDDRACKKHCGLLRRAVMAVGIVILAETMVLASTIDVCSSDQAGCLRAFFLKPVSFAAGFVPEFARR
jgi:hypothetical protein